MADVPDWLKDVPVPTDEEFEAYDRRRSEREIEADAVAARMWEAPPLTPELIAEGQRIAAEHGLLRRPGH